MLLRFEDGGVVEFVSPRSDRLLQEALRQDADRFPEWRDIGGLEAGAQLPLDGLFRSSPGSGAAAVVS
jgi:hypothetical protein